MHRPDRAVAVIPDVSGVFPGFLIKSQLDRSLKARFEIHIKSYMGTGSPTVLLMCHLALCADLRIDIAFQYIRRKIRNAQLDHDANLAGELCYQRKTILSESPDRAEFAIGKRYAIGQFTGNTAVQSGLCLQGNRNSNATDTTDANEADLDLVQIQRFHQICFNAIVDICITVQFNRNLLFARGNIILDRGIFDFHLDEAAGTEFIQRLLDLDRSIQLNLTGCLALCPCTHGPFRNHRIQVLFTGVLIDIDDLRTFLRNEVCELGIHTALGFHGYIVQAFIHSAYINDCARGIILHGFSSVQTGDPLKVNRENTAFGQLHRTVVNGHFCARGLYFGAVRDLDHICSELIDTFKVLVNDPRVQNSNCIRDHNIDFSLGNGLFRQEGAFHQRKPSAVNCDLDIVGIGHFRRFPEIQFRFRVCLESKAEIHGGCCEFTSRRFFRTQTAAGWNIHHAKLHRQEHIVVVFRFAAQVTEIVIGIVVSLNGHGKCFDQCLKPLRPCHDYGHLSCVFCCIGIQCGQRNHAEDHHQRQQETDPSF